MSMLTSNRPYLIRAIYSWLVDNDCTPHVVVDAHHEGVSVPQSYVEKGQIVLNVAPRAIQNFSMDLETLVFSTRFGGVPTDIFVPMMAILGIYARENGQGLMFSDEPTAAKAPKKTESFSPKAVPSSPISSISSSSTRDGDKPDDTPPKISKKSPKGKPSLKVIK